MTHIPRSWLGAVLILSAMTRLAVMAPALAQGGAVDDPDNYLPLAEALAEGQGFVFNDRPTAYRPPLYPLVLAPLVAVLGARVALGVLGLHLALGVATTALTFLAARRWGMSPARAVVASAIVACDPVLVVQVRSVMTETLAAFLVALTLWALADPARDGLRGAVLGGVGFGLAALCRPSLLPAAVLTVLAALIAKPEGRAVRLARAALIATAMILTMTPWALRNAWVLGEPVWTTTHGGYTLALANNPVYYREVLDGPSGAVWSGPNQRRWWDEVNRRTAGMTEPEANRYLRRSGLQMLADRPSAFARASLARLGRFWGVAPSGAVYPTWLRAVTAAWTVPLWVALVVGLVRRSLWRWPAVAAPMLLWGLTAVHAVYWTDLRMRAPLVPAIALIAAQAHRVVVRTKARSR